MVKRLSCRFSFSLCFFLHFVLFFWGFSLHVFFFFNVNNIHIIGIVLLSPSLLIIFFFS